MMDGPHIFGFSPDAFCINLTSALASARRLASVSESMNSATLILVGLVLLSAIPHSSILNLLFLTFGATVSSLPFQKIRHRLDVKIWLVYKRHVAGLRHDCQL